MEITSREPSGIRQKENLQEKPRSSEINNLLSKAMMYYASGKNWIGERTIEIALESATGRGENITPQEIAYIVSGGKGTPPEGEKPEALKPPEAEESNQVKNSIGEFKKKLLEIGEPLMEIKKILGDIADRILATIEKKSPSQTPSSVMESPEAIRSM